MMQCPENRADALAREWAGSEASLGRRSRDQDLLGVEEVARRLGLKPSTVWRWCREGRLPCMKMGKSWRIRPEALEEFIRRTERPATLEGELGQFLRVPDSVLAVAPSPELLRRLDAAFLKAAEARDGLLIKFHGEATDEDELRERLEEEGLGVGRLEREGRLYLREEPDAPVERVETLCRLLSDEASAGPTLWVTFDWPEATDPETALEQQRALTEQAVASGRLVVKTALLEESAAGWPPKTLRRAQALHSGTMWLSEDDLVLSRTKPLTAI